MKRIDNVAVLGAGVMGSAIAAHLANSGLDVVLLDMAPPKLTEDETAKGLTLDSPQVRDRFVNKGLAACAKASPASFYSLGLVSRIETGNFDDDISKISKCGWIIEVVLENMEIKKKLYTEKVIPHAAEGAILSTNTSGLSVNELALSLPEEMRKRFLVTHFFNPPRYMRLMEIVASKYTDPAAVAHMAEFINHRLGKGIVYAKDTPNFIANRIGIFAVFNAIRHMTQMGMTVEEVDSVAGQPSGKPKSAVFRTADLVGVDLLDHVGKNSYDHQADDPDREEFKTPKVVTELIEKGLLGQKSGSGFYKKVKENGKSVIFHYDYNTGDYAPPAKPRFASVGQVRQIDDSAARVKALLNGKDKAAQFAWATTRDTLLYTFKRIPEIADDVVNIDNAMKWGYNWDIGPFEMMDAIGVESFVKRAKADGVEVPEALTKIKSFYHHEEARKTYFDVKAGDGYSDVPVAPGAITFDILKRAGAEVERNSAASILDLGDGVFGLEFHSKMNAVGGDTLGMAQKAVRRAEAEGVALVVGNQGTMFSAGANLMTLAVAIAEGVYEDIDLMIRMFQKATMGIKYAKVPVVVAPYNLTLGGGAEFVLHADSVCAHAETYMGMVEIGVGLLPAGGGTKEVTMRSIQLAQENKTDVQPFIARYFENIGLAKVSRSALELYELGYLRHGDSVTMDIARLIPDAKQKALALAANYRPSMPATDLKAPGRSVAATIRSMLWNMRMGGFATEYEEYIGGIIANVMSGGDVPVGTLVSEQYLLDLEREGFLKLCGNKKTLERIQNMLKTGKALRN
ncbi:MAG: 3-hydroxyacyl-CoA dehydrogenase/enoyl-CoA hydratase family protein [Nitrospinota bacterium]|nr:3-hydroxyacyl-CoA dehydrogenase/enoyl-CoA hydratase family protein [Nitrospinota bacterium]